MPVSKKRLAEIEAIPDYKIVTDDIPELTADFFQTAELVVPKPHSKTAVSLRVDEDVLQWFKAQGKGHLSRMNAVLRAYMISQNTEKERAVSSN